MNWIAITALLVCVCWSLGEWGEKRRARALHVGLDRALDQSQRSLEREAAMVRALQAAMLLVERLVAGLPSNARHDVDGELHRLKGLLENVHAPTPELRPGRAHLKVVVH